MPGMTPHLRSVFVPASLHRFEWTGVSKRGTRVSGRVSGQGDSRCFVFCMCMCFPTSDLGVPVLSYRRLIRPPASSALGINYGHRGMAPQGVASPRFPCHVSNGPHRAPPNLMTPGLRPGTPRSHGSRLRRFTPQKSQPPLVCVCCWLCVFWKHHRCRRRDDTASLRRVFDCVRLSADDYSCPFPHTHASITEGSHSDRDRTGLAPPQAQPLPWPGPGTKIATRSPGGRIAARRPVGDVNPRSGNRLPHGNCRVSFRVEAWRFAECRLLAYRASSKAACDRVERSFLMSGSFSPAHDFFAQTRHSWRT